MATRKKRKKRTLKTHGHGLGKNVLGMYYYKISMPSKAISGATPFMYRDQAEAKIDNLAKELGGKVTRFERG